MSKVKTLRKGIEKAAKAPEKQVASSDAHQPPGDLPLSKRKGAAEADAALGSRRL